MARIEGVPAERAGLLGRLAYRMARRRYGKVMEPLTVMAHHRGVMAAYGGFEMMAERTWHKLGPTVGELAVLRTATVVGCAWCVDFGSWLTQDGGMTEAKVRDVTRWRDSDAYSPRERRAIAYAEAMSATPMTVDDSLVAELLADLGEAALVELTMQISLENLRGRFNHALGLTSQGFAEHCAVPTPA
jgi:AhpD family alkylhydroperoxidase